MSDTSIQVRRALLSVYDKTGLVEIGRVLADLGVEILSTGGTARALAKSGVPVTLIETVTRAEEMLDGRVKTLHPVIHAGIVADRSRASHVEELRRRGISPIDLVVANLYPFEDVAARPDCPLTEAIEQIDVGGPAMIRAAAKNHSGVAVLTAPEQYPAVAEEMRGSGGAVSAPTRWRLACQAFARTAAYDAAISAYLRAQDEEEDLFPPILAFGFHRASGLRYGENPHQRAAFYRDPYSRETGVATARQLNGEALSFVNLLDLDAGLDLVREFDTPACAIIKHTNPCGCATSDLLPQAYRLAREAELPPFNPPGARFGGVIAANRPVDEETASEIVAPQSFYHAVIAPGFGDRALEILTSRQGWGPSLRVLATGQLPGSVGLADAARGLDRLDFKRVAGGMLLQERDRADVGAAELQFVTARRPEGQELADLLFAWKVVRHVKSNAVVLAVRGQMIGLGAGQVNRAEACALALKMAGPRASGSVCASDAFFPMPDGPESLALGGVAAIIQPGGSKRDQDTIAVCDRHGLAMVFTGRRHFRH
jgi:phosphoribosylaminoimidazolecarboxamide formyltransferase/IMP cyclohydrolase